MYWFNSSLICLLKGSINSAAGSPIISRIMSGSNNFESSHEMPFDLDFSRSERLVSSTNSEVFSNPERTVSALL